MLLSLQIYFSLQELQWPVQSLRESLKSSFKSTVSRYLKIITVPSLCPLTLISLDAICAVCHPLVFSALIAILYLVPVLSRLSTRAVSFCSPQLIGKPQISSISAASAKFSIIFFQSIRDYLFEKNVEEVTKYTLALLRLLF